MAAKNAVAKSWELKPSSDGNRWSTHPAGDKDFGTTLHWTGTTLSTDGSASDVQAKINAASSGDTVEIPAGSFTWASQVSIPDTKAIHLKGAGSGRVVARSESSVAVGTGTKTFTVSLTLDQTITAGQTLRIERTGTAMSGGNPTGTRTWMEGTVTSLVGSTLTMNITSTAGSGTHPLWICVTPADTTVTMTVADDGLIVSENASNYQGISGIRFVGITTSDKYQLKISGSTTTKPVLAWGNFFETGSSGSVRAETPHGWFADTSFAAFPFSAAPVGIEVKALGYTTSWTTNHTIGNADTTGEANFYIEVCDFHAYLNCTDFDDNCRAVLRGCLINNAGLGSHGADTSTDGVRHVEIYDSQFVFNGYGDGNTFNLNWFLYLRGGCWVLTDCSMTDITSTDYGGKTEINMQVQNLRRNSGPYACWSGGYPAPHQVGRGYVVGTGSVLDPCYFWNNSGTYSADGVNYSPDECGGGPDVSTCIQASRDYYVDGTARPGYVKYTYPHPLRAGCPTS